MGSRSYSFRQAGAVWSVSGILALLGPTAHLDAQPSVRVRATTRIELHAMRAPEEVRIRGNLMDDLDAPLPDRSLELRVSGEYPSQGTERRQLRTDDSGGFRAALKLKAGSYRLSAVFAGDDYYPASEQSRLLDLSHADVLLQFEQPTTRRIDLDLPTHDIVIRASSAEGGAGIEIILSDELGRTLAAASTDASGHAKFELESEALGPPSLGKLAARGAADARRAASEAQISIVRYRPTRLSIATSWDPAGDEPVVSGTLSDSGGGLARKAVGIFDGEAHVATVLTDQHGAFLFRDLERPAVGESERTMRLSARFEADAPWVGSSRSQTLEVNLAPADQPSALWLGAPLALCALVLLVMRHRGRAERSVGAPKARGSMHAGIHKNSPLRRARAPSNRVSGRIADAQTGAALATAEVALFGPDETAHRIGADGAGVFVSPPLAPGEWSLVVSAQGFAQVQGQLTLPHRGEWTDMQVRLQSLRSAAWSAYSPAAATALGSAERVLYSTPRETLQHAEQLAAPPASLVRLTDRIEHAAYGAEAPDSATIAQIESDALESLAQLRTDENGHVAQARPSSVTPKRRQ